MATITGHVQLDLMGRPCLLLFDYLPQGERNDTVLIPSVHAQTPHRVWEGSSAEVGNLWADPCYSTGDVGHPCGTPTSLWKQEADLDFNIADKSMVQDCGARWSADVASVVACSSPQICLIKPLSPVEWLSSNHVTFPKHSWSSGTCFKTVSFWLYWTCKAVSADQVAAYTLPLISQPAICFNFHVISHPTTFFMSSASMLQPKQIMHPFEIAPTVWLFYTS